MALLGLFYNNIKSYSPLTCLVALETLWQSRMGTQSHLLSDAHHLYHASASREGPSPCLPSQGTSFALKISHRCLLCPRRTQPTLLHLVPQKAPKALNLSFLVEVIDARSASWPATHRFGAFDLYSVQIIFFRSLSTQVLFGYILFNLQLLGVFFSDINQFLT